MLNFICNIDFDFNNFVMEILYFTPCVASIYIDMGIYATICDLTLLLTTGKIIY